MNKIKIKKVGEWIYRIVCFIILESFIMFVGFTALHYCMSLFETRGIFNEFGVKAGLIQLSLAIAYLQIANIFYWIMNINLFDFKKLWRGVSK